MIILSVDIVVKLLLVELIKMLVYFFNPNKVWLKNYSLKKYRHKMPYSESELDSDSLSIFASIFSKSESKCESESDFNSVFMNLDICIFLTLYLHSSK